MDNKDIKDYLHLYLGRELFGTYLDASGSRGILTGVTNGGHECEIQFFLEDGINVEEEPEWNEAHEVKLILRPLSDMTEEEGIECATTFFHDCEGKDVKVEDNYGTKKIIWRTASIHFPDVYYTPDITRYLLSKGFDLFGLIDAGLAIDKTKLKVNGQ